MAQHTQYDPLDATLLLTRQKLSPGQRIQAMLDAREMLVGLMRGRLRRRYPNLSTKELNLKLLEEIDRVRQIRSRP